MHPLVTQYLALFCRSQLKLLSPLPLFARVLPFCPVRCCLVTKAMSDSLVTPWTVTHLAPLSMGSPREEYWSGLPFPALLHWEVNSLPPSHRGSLTSQSGYLLLPSFQNVVVVTQPCSLLPKPLFCPHLCLPQCSTQRLPPRRF